MTRRPEGIPEAVWQKFVADSAPRDAAARERGVQAAEAMLGRTLPEDLRVAGWSEAPEGSIFEPGLQALAAGEGNVVERLVDEAGRGNHETVLHWLTGCHYYGDIESDGDCLFMALPSVRRVDRGAVGAAVGAGVVADGAVSFAWCVGAASNADSTWPRGACARRCLTGLVGTDGRCWRSVASCL